MPTLMSSSLSVYRNGMTQFTKRFRLDSGEPERIGLPVLDEDIDALYASHQIFGDVSITQPLQHLAPNTDPSRKGVDTHDHGGLYTYLANQFTGAKVRICRRGFWGRTVSGALAYTAPAAASRRATHGNTAQFLLETKPGLIVPVPFADVASIELLDKYERELFANLVEDCRRRRRDNFTEAAVTVQGEERTEFSVTYCLQGVSPAFMYRLIHDSDKNSLVLVGQVKVTNSFADDWENVEIFIPTTQPRPIRAPAARGRHDRQRYDYPQEESGQTMMSMSFSDQGRGSLGRARMDHVARGADANVEELGDGHIFKVVGKLSLPAGASAMPLLFRLEMGSPEPVIHAGNEIQRGFRFRYTGDFKIPSGPCVVYSGTTIEGEGQLKLSLPKQRRIVCHATQQGVAFAEHDRREYVTTLACLGKDDELVARVRHRVDTEYRVENRTGKKHTLVFERENTFPAKDSKIRVVNKSVRWNPHGENGRRYLVPISDSHEPEIFGITEVFTEDRRVRIHQQGINLADWLSEFIFRSDEPKLFDGKKFKPVRDLLRKIKVSRDAVSKLEREILETNRRIADVRENLRAVGNADTMGGQKEKFANELEELDNKVKQLGDDRARELKEIDEENAELLKMMQTIKLGDFEEEPDEPAGAVSAAEAE